MGELSFLLLLAGVGPFALEQLLAFHGGLCFRQQIAARGTQLGEAGAVEEEPVWIAFCNEMENIILVRLQFGGQAEGGLIGK